MLHRNLTQDDGKGLEEAMIDDKACTYTFWAYIKKKSDPNYSFREKLRLNHPLQLLIPNGRWEMANTWKTNSKLSRSFGKTEGYHILSWKVHDNLRDIPQQRINSVEKFEYLMRVITFNVNTPVESLMR